MPHLPTLPKNTDRHFVSKGWGFEDWIVNKSEYCGKLLFVKKGRRCSWHYHEKKDETFYVQSGLLILRVIEPEVVDWYKQKDISLEVACTVDALQQKCVILEPGDSFHVPVGMIHQFEGRQDTVFFEFSTTHDDADSIRVVRGD